MDRQMQALIDAPLANPLKINLPAGRSPARRAAKPEYEGEFTPEKLTSKQIRERRQDQFSAKLSAVLDHYARTDVPFDRIEAHTKLSSQQVIAAMQARGRSS